MSHYSGSSNKSDRDIEEFEDECVDDCDYGDQDVEEEDIKTPLILEGQESVIKTPGFRDLVFQFPNVTPRSILKSSNSNRTRTFKTDNNIQSDESVSPSPVFRRSKYLHTICDRM